ncbi:MAG: TlpA disulfide reductase family protein [Woeseiaceae bacterium]|nr:TlpA disulfide reductase family protein [Woeseiaceae bacterium]
MEKTINRAIAFALLALACVSGCDSPQQVVATPPQLQAGYWQASITLPGGDIETGFEINRSGDAYQASLINGQERVRIDQVAFADGELLLRFPAFNNEIRAKLVDGNLVGQLTLVKRFGETEVMPFSATHGNKPIQHGNEPPSHDLSGRWRVRFHEPDGSDSPSIGEFAQRGSRLFGTFINPNGDYRYLAGHVSGSQFDLSTFDGAHAFIFAGEVNETGTIENANFWSGTSWHQTWSAFPDQNVELPDSYSRTYLNPGHDSFEFEFPDPDGRMVSLRDDKFAGKVVLVTIAGTWCPNCNDEARMLAPLHKELRNKGLEVVALMFEHFEDHDIAAQQVRNFRDKFDIEYETLIAGISDKTEASKTLPALSGVLAFPTTVFIDRSGRVRKIHTGFSGPGTGEHYLALQQEFRKLINELLAEPANLIETVTSDGSQ